MEGEVKNKNKMEKPKNCTIVIFGASGDLTKRKLMPAIFELYKQKLLPEKFAVLGVSRNELSDDDFRKVMFDAIKEFAFQPDDEIIKSFVNKIHYMHLNFTDTSEYEKVKTRLEGIESSVKTSNTIYYLATPPAMFGVIAGKLSEVGLNKPCEDCFTRLVVEKPFGTDLESAIELNKKLHELFDESQIYRIDHYLGKETVQNIFVTRFSNGIFEPIWNRNYVHHVEITSAESIGVENRGGYYDSAGALRDMVQNHLMRIVGFIALEPPSSFDADSIRNEKLKVLQALKPIKEKNVGSQVIRGQYISSTIRGEKIAGYREENQVAPDSRTETFVAMKFFIDNWRWGGVPFYIRTGKRMPTRVTEAVIHFKPTPHYLFKHTEAHNKCNQFILRIQPDEGILLKFGVKVPGSGYEVQTVNMDFHYSDIKQEHLPEAYERLLHDCMIGDATLFARADSVEVAWKFVAPIQNAWKNNPDLKVFGYPAGTWGPENADELIEGEGHQWRYPCKNLTDDGTYCEL